MPTWIDMKLCKCGQIVSGICSTCYPPRTHGRTTKERGYGSDHKAASARWRTLHPLCERCVMLRGVVDANVAADMHHVVSIADNESVRMMSSNWLSLCRECHEAIEGDTLHGMRVRQWSDANYDNALNGEPCNG